MNFIIILEDLLTLYSIGDIRYMPHFNFIFPYRVHGDLERCTRSGQGINHTILYSGNQIEIALFKAFNEVLGIILVAPHPKVSILILTCHLLNY